MIYIIAITRQLGVFLIKHHYMEGRRTFHFPHLVVRPPPACLFFASLCLFLTESVIFNSSLLLTISKANK